MTKIDSSFTLPEFSPNDRAHRVWARVLPRTERLLDEFMSQWRQALGAIVPANVEIRGVSLACKSYAQFVKDAPAFSDIQVYEIEALQSLCAWSLDVAFVSDAVDSMFGGTGRVVPRDPNRLSRSPIESDVRRRLYESLATAYESVWQAQHPIRLNPLRKEALVSSLRLTALNEPVVHACMVVELNRRPFVLEQCLPLRALDCLDPGAEPPTLIDPPQTLTEDVPGRSDNVVERVQEAPVEVVALLGQMELTVAQLMSLSIGQVLPFQMNEQVPLQVDGVRILSGRSGVRDGRHAVKVELPSTVHQQDLKARFTPLSQSLDQEPSSPAPMAAGTVTEAPGLNEEASQAPKPSAANTDSQQT